MFAAVLVLALLQATPVPSPSPTPLPPTPLAVNPAQVLLSPAQIATVSLIGGLPPFSATLTPQIATVAVDQNARVVTITAAGQQGRATLHIAAASGAAIDVPVRIALPAGTVTKSATLRITGTVDPGWLQKTIAWYVGTLTSANPGTKPAIGAFSVGPPPAPGTSTALNVPVTIPGGEQYLDVADVTNLTVVNVVAPNFGAPVLFYDDDPEMISAPGVLYRGTVSADRPVRLYYYHENGRDPHDLYVLLSAQTPIPATVHVIDSSAGPNIDVMSVGHAVTRNFLAQKPSNQGVLLDVPSDRPFALRAFELQALDGAAGNVDLRIVNGGPVNVSVVAVPAATSAAQLTQYLSGPQLPDDGHHRTGVFNLNGYADASDPIEFVVGGEDASLLYGAQSPPVAQSNSNWHDYGEYGVLRQIAFNLTNPTRQPATVYVYERPQGGVVRGSFLVDGKLHEVGCARVSEKYLIAPLSVGAATERHMITTMTDGGSNYPVEVGLTMAPPQPTTPPMFAPNGCFPKP